jgi:hypothetical protein
VRACPYLAFAWALALAHTLALADTPPRTLTDLMQQLAHRPHDHASYVERQYLAVLDRPVETSGELFYDAPDRLEKRTLLPKPETLILTGGRLEIHRGRRSYSLALGDAPQIAPFIDSIRAILAGALPELEQAYVITFGLEGPQWTLELVPRKPALAALIAQIRIVGAGDRMQSVEIRRADGDRSLMTISDLPGR